MNQDELNRKFMVFEQKIRQVQEQLGVVQQAILDLSQIDSGLNELVGKVLGKLMKKLWPQLEEVYL